MEALSPTCAEPHPNGSDHPQEECLILSLEPALALRILLFLSCAERNQWALASKRANLLACDESIWRDTCHRRFPGSRTVMQPIQNCWRLETIKQKRAEAFKQAYSQGRAGRISTELPALARVSIYEHAEMPALPTASVGTEAPPANKPHTTSGGYFESPERRAVRQGSCTWSVLGPSYPGANPYQAGVDINSD